MSSSTERIDRAVTLASACAFVLVAHLVAAKAVRDALFLLQFPVTYLPRMVIGASLLSLIAVLGASRAVPRVGPGRFLTGACVAGALLEGVLAATVRSAPRLVAVVMYLNVAVFGAILVSWLWSLLNEGLDPRTARRRVGRIAGGGILGGLAGGLGAERIASHFATEAVLPVLAALLVVTAVLAAATARALTRSGEPSDEGPQGSGFAVLRTNSYVRTIAAFVIAGTVAATVLDYVFKTAAAAAYSGDDLLRCFAIFYTATNLGAFAVQSLATKRLLAHGLAPAASALPLVIAFGAAVILAAPAFAVIAVVRGLESAMRSSLFRSSYELFYTPVSRADKRAAKTIIDVGCERLGDVLGAGIVQLLLVTGASSRPAAMLAIPFALGVVGWMLARRLGRGYTRALEANLLRRSPFSSLASASISSIDGATLLFSTADSVDPTEERPPAPYPTPTPTPTPESHAPAPGTLADVLASGNVERVRHALRELDVPSPDVTPQLARLVAWDRVATDVVEVLRRVCDRDVELFVRVMLDPNEAFATRRRIARVLGSSSSPPAIDGLLGALRDARFEVRFHAGVSLARIHERHPDMPVDANAVVIAVEREARVNRHVWESQRLLDDTDREESPFYDDVLRTRASRSLEHVFNLLSIVHSSRALRIAYRGLHAEDRHLRGTALEYLEQILSEPLREALWPLLDDDRQVREPGRDPREVLQSLLQSHDSIRLDLERQQGMG